MTSAVPSLSIPWAHVVSDHLFSHPVVAGVGLHASPMCQAEGRLAPVRTTLSGYQCQCNTRAEEQTDVALCKAISSAFLSLLLNPRAALGMAQTA